MAHYHIHGGYARAAQRRDEQYAMCITCGRRSSRFQAEPSEPETFSDFAKAMAVAVLLVAAGYAAVLVLAAYRVTV